MKRFIVKKSITLDAPPAEVWDALTNPEKTKKYFFNCSVFSQWKVGSPIVFKGRIFLFKKIELKGTILQIEPQRFLQYSLTNGTSESASSSTVTDLLSFKDGKTRLSITDDVGPEEGAEKRYNRSLKGWEKVLNGLKKLVEKK